MPISGTRLWAKASEMEMYGKACTKLVVPSMGSTMNVGAGVRREEEGVGEDSSPRNLWGGSLVREWGWVCEDGVGEGREGGKYL